MILQVAVLLRVLALLVVRGQPLIVRVNSHHASVNGGSDFVFHWPVASGFDTLLLERSLTDRRHETGVTLRHSLVMHVHRSVRVN